MSVYTYLDLSTSHITKEDNELLYDNSELPMIAAYEDGFWLHVPQDLGDFAECVRSLVTGGYSNSLIGLMVYAFKHGHPTIRLDRDADIDEQFPTHNW